MTATRDCGRSAATEHPQLPRWQKVPPAAPGWYPASIERNVDARRHWSGSAWSAPCYADDPRGHFDRARVTPAESLGVEWLRGAAA